MSSGCNQTQHLPHQGCMLAYATCKEWCYLKAVSQAWELLEGCGPEKYEEGYL